MPKTKKKAYLKVTTHIYQYMGQNLDINQDR